MVVRWHFSHLINLNIVYFCIIVFFSSLCSMYVVSDVCQFPLIRFFVWSDINSNIYA